ncbi:serine/threonine-protein kinase [Streptomyces sp. NPDC004609]|uniref:serine/threonine-protein kinase n=1 Tax=Streptomyces sp. NPDC004609 TaxID=3364704 RepID=UPI00369E3291
MSTPGEMVDGRFELIERLGSGGMGTVWRARDTALHREVALKEVRHEGAASDSVRERVLREARALARLSHPHVVTVHHIVDTDPHPWIVMELVTGSSLDERLNDGPMAPARAAGIGRQVLSALRAAHAAGIQHRDVKPANILLRADGTAVLTDFGIAALQGSTSLTATGELVGSPEYIAPERIRGRNDDPASDLWSLGVVLYVCAEGVSPLRRPTTLATLAAVLDEPVPSPVRSGPLAPVLEALLVRDPGARPDAAALEAMLARVESGGVPEWARPTMTSVVPPPLPPGPPPGPGGLGTVPPVPTRIDTPRPPVPDATVPSPSVPGSPGPRDGSRSRTAAVVVAVIAVVAVVATTALLLALRDAGNDKSDARPGPAGAAAPPASAASSSAPSPAPSSTPSPTASPKAEAPSSPQASKPAPESEREPVPAPERPSAPPPASGGRWIAQLFSEPVSSGTDARDLRLARVRESVPEAVYVRSDDYASLRPGFWVIYAPGPFADGRAALAFCGERGRNTANACIGRYLSGSSADQGLQCRPPASSPTGRCTRS